MRKFLIAVVVIFGVAVVGLVVVGLLVLVNVDGFVMISFMTATLRMTATAIKNFRMSFRLLVLVSRN